MISVMISIYYIVNFLNKVMIKKVDNVSLPAGKYYMFSVGRLQFVSRNNS